MRNGISNTVQLFASQNYSDEWSRLARVLDFVSYELLILVAVTLLVIFTVVWQSIARRRRHDFHYDSPQRLLADLCRAHKLNRTQRRLLKQLATSRGLKTPVPLFVEPEHFDMTNIPSALKASVAELRQLRHRLFE